MSQPARGRTRQERAIGSLSDQQLIAEALTRMNQLLAELRDDVRALRTAIDSHTDALYHHAGGRP